MMIKLSTTLSASLGEVWALVKRSDTLTFVAAPLVIFKPLEPQGFPRVWQVGLHRARLSLFGVLSLGAQVIDISYPSPHALRDNGRGSLAQTWDHLITLEALGHSETRYTDTVNVKAGLLTAFIWAFAHVFYRYRQWRWQRWLGINAAPTPKEFHEFLP